MFTSPNMGLTVWDLTIDDFDHTQLEQNWVAVDNHDHSNGRGVQIGTGGIVPNAITQPLLAAAAVGNPQLQTAAVGTSNLQNAAVGNAQLAPGSVFGSVVPPGAIVASMLDPTIVPLGGVMLWWRPPGSGATPGGFWEAMDGRAWSAITNAWGLTTGSIPDTRGHFAKGADLLGTNGPAVGTTGGSSSANLSHSHNVNAHSHTLNDHAHGIFADGTHIHTWAGGLSMATRTNCFPQGLQFQAFNGTWQSNTFYSMYVKNLLSNPQWFQQGPNGQTSQTTDAVLDMDDAGSHTHGGFTAGAGQLLTNSSTATTDSKLGSTTIDPPWNGLLYIMRVR